MSNDLKPCPFCGGKAEHSIGKTGDGKPWHYVECVDCGATGPTPDYADHNIAVIECRAEAWNTRADRIEELEAKLAKCSALMHAGLAEYQRRLVGVIEASIAVRSAQKTYFKDRSKDNLIASKQAETSLDKLLVDLEGEIDD